MRIARLKQLVRIAVSAVAMDILDNVRRSVAMRVVISLVTALHARQRYAPQDCHLISESQRKTAQAKQLMRHVWCPVLKVTQEKAKYSLAVLMALLSGKWFHALQIRALMVFHLGKRLLMIAWAKSPGKHARYPVLLATLVTVRHILAKQPASSVGACPHVLRVVQPTQSQCSVVWLSTPTLHFWMESRSQWSVQIGILATLHLCVRWDLSM